MRSRQRPIRTNSRNGRRIYWRRSSRKTRTSNFRRRNKNNRSCWISRSSNDRSPLHHKNRNLRRRKSHKKSRPQPNNEARSNIRRTSLQTRIQSGCTLQLARILGISINLLTNQYTMDCKCENCKMCDSCNCDCENACNMCGCDCKNACDKEGGGCGCSH
jgi:hypothetical protein